MSPTIHKRPAVYAGRQEETMHRPPANELEKGRETVVRAYPQSSPHTYRSQAFDTLSTLLQEGEGTRVEFKLRAPSADRLAKLICAFANTSGGHILMGVDDGAIVEGVEDIGETRDAIDRALMMVTPTPEVRITELRLDEERVVVMCAVGRGRDKPCRAANARGGEAAYIRVGSAIMPVPKGEEARLEREDAVRSRISLEKIHEKILKIVERNPGITLKKITQACNLSAYRVRKALVPLLQSGLVVEKNPGRYTLR